VRAFRHSIYDSDTPDSIRTTTLWLIDMLTFGFFAADMLLSNDSVNIGIDVILGVMSTVALLYYLGRAVRALWTHSKAHVDYLIVAIALSWWSQDGQAWLRVIACLSGFDHAFVNSEPFGLLKLGSVIAAILHVLPRGAADGKVPRSNKITIVASLIFAVGLAGVIVVARPDPSPLINGMPQWSKDLFKSGAMRAARSMHADAMPLE
jgi:hypothetical protein